MVFFPVRFLLRLLLFSSFYTFAWRRQTGTNDDEGGLLCALSLAGRLFRVVPSASDYKYGVSRAGLSTYIIVLQHASVRLPVQLPVTYTPQGDGPCGPGGTALRPAWW